MAQRRVVASDEDEEMGLIHEKKVHGNANYDLLRLRDMERFIAKFYWMVIIIYIGIGAVFAAVLTERSFKEIFMAESLISSVGVTTYVVLFMILLMCHSHREMRIVILLTLCWFIGCLLYTSPSPRDATLSRMPSSA